MSRPAGQRHYRATLTDHEIAIAIELIETYGYSSREVAEKFDGEITASAVRRWVNGSRRSKRAAL